MMIVAQNINPFTGLGELGNEINDLRSLVVFVVLMFGIGMIYLLIDRNRTRRDNAVQETRRKEIDSQSKLEEIRAQEDATLAAANRDMFNEFVKASNKQSEAMQMVAAAIERGNSVGMANSQAITANTEAIYGNTQSIKLLPEAIGGRINSAAEKNMNQYSAQMTGIQTALQQVDKGVQDIKNELCDKQWIDNDMATKINATQEKLIEIVNQLSGKFSTQEILVVSLDNDKKEGES